MSDLVEFIQARLDEDDELARFAQPFFENRDLLGEMVRDGFDAEVPEHAVRHDPMRILREVEAKRRILGEHAYLQLTWWPDPMCGTCSDPQAQPVPDPLGARAEFTPNAIWPCRTVRLLALPYSDHIDYRHEWHP